MNWTYFWAVFGSLVVFGALAFQLFFDWKKEPTLRARHVGLAVWGLGGVFVAFMSARAQSKDSKETTKQLDTCNAGSAECNAKVTQLSQAVKTGEEEARRNAEVQQTTLMAFGEKLGRIKGEAMSEREKAQIADLEKQLATANAPKPRAVLVGSFATDDRSLFPVKETRATRQNGVVKFDLAVRNMSDVVAESGAIWVRLCQGCTFAKTPPGFEKPEGTRDFDRDKEFSRVYPDAAILDIPIEAAVPDYMTGTIEVQIIVKCLTCVPESKTSLTVHIVDTPPVAGG